LTAEQRQLIVKYARLPRSITRSEWIQALQAFDLLHTGRVVKGRRTLTFQRFYQQTIDAKYATTFLEDILLAENVEEEGQRYVASYGHQMISELANLGISGDTVEVRALLAYCLYWWQSFGKGYIREVAVFRDLEESDVIFEAHDLRDPAQRRSPYDLIVLEQHGDIKTSTYFLHNARLFPLRCDFYIVCLFDENTSRWLDIVLLKPEAWRKLNGEPTHCTWDNVAHTLPSVVQVELRGESRVVVPYSYWKERVLCKQSREGEKPL
jgi:hypothetical protein